MVFNKTVRIYIVKFVDYPKNLKVFLDNSYKSRGVVGRGRSFCYDQLLFWSKDKDNVEDFLKYKDEKQAYNL